jgi:hypothetical protein
VTFGFHELLKALLKGFESFEESLKVSVNQQQKLLEAPVNQQKFLKA